MRKLLFLFIAVLAFSCSSDDGGNTTNPEVTNPEPENPGSGGCKYLHDSVTLKTQKDVDSFAANNYCIVDGNLFIGDIRSYSDIKDLSGLSSLKEIRGQFAVWFNGELVNLHGLENLQKVQTLFIVQNENLETLEHLTSFIEASPFGDTGSWIEIIRNPKIKNLKGLEKLENVQKITVALNEELLDLKDLIGLKKINHLCIASSSKITTLEGLNNVVHLGILELRYNKKLTTLQGLTGLKTMADFLCYGNDELISLSGLEQITKMEKLVLQYNPKLNSLQSFHNVTKMASLDLEGNPLLTSLQGLENVKTLSGIMILDSPNISSLSPLNGVTAFVDHPDPYSIPFLGIYLSKTGITSLSGLQNITSYKGSFLFDKNSQLNDFCAINSIVPSATSFEAKNNAYNPTKEDILAGNCSQ